MKILILCSRIPYPLNDGGNLAVNNILEGLLQMGEEVSMLSMNTSKHWVNPNELPAIFQKLHHFSTVDVDNSIKPLPALLDLIKNKSYNISRFISPTFERELRKIITSQHFDVVLLEGLFVTPYLATIRKFSQAKICYRQHNVEFQIWERLSQEAKNPLKKWYLNKLATALKSYELKLINQYDGIAAIAPTDKELYQALGCTVPITVIPFGLKLETESKEETATKTDLKCYHLGAMDWQPNIEGVKWLVEEVWPLVIAQAPNASLHLAGRKFNTNTHYSFQKNVIIHGAVEDAGQFEGDKDILLVPIHSGGGLRIKTLIAMNKGKAVVSTSVGLQGIEQARHNQEVIIANSKEQFADGILALYQNPNLSKQLGNNAKSLAQTTYSQHRVIKNLLDHIAQICKKT